MFCVFILALHCFISKILLKPTFTEILKTIPEEYKISNLVGYDVAYVSDTELVKKWGNKEDRYRLNGVFIPSEHTIYIKKYMYNDTIVYHEIGHIIDKELGWVSETEEFAEIYKKECKNTRKYAQSSPQEFFADAYALIVEDRADDIPEAKAYITKQLNRLNRIAQ